MYNNKYSKRYLLRFTIDTALIIAVIATALLYSLDITCASSEEFECTFTDYPNSFGEDRIQTVKENKNINLAASASLKIVFLNGSDTHKWGIADTGIARITSSKVTKYDEDIAYVTGLSKGKTKISIIDMETEEAVACFYITVTDPDVTSNLKRITLIGSRALQLKLTGTTTSPKRALSIDDSKVSAFVEDGLIYAGNLKKGYFSIYIDGKEIKCYAVSYSDPYIIIKNGKSALCKEFLGEWSGDFRKKPRYCMYITKKMSSRIIMKGIPKNATVVYKSSKGKILKVSERGKLKGLKKGYSVIKVSIDGYTVKAKIYVVSKRQMKILKKGFKMSKKVMAGKIKYSMSKRMKSKYADCSSFTWKVMKAGKYRFGSKTAPGAGGEYRYCKKKHKVLKTKSYKKTMPCDVVFFRYSGYKEGHVEVAIGYDSSIGIGARPMGDIPSTCMKVSHIARPVK